MITAPTANLSSRMCYADQDTRDNMNFDTCHHGRHHCQTLYERARGEPVGSTQRQSLQHKAPSEECLPKDELVAIIAATVTADGRVTATECAALSRNTVYERGSTAKVCIRC